MAYICIPEVDGGCRRFWLCDEFERNEDSEGLSGMLCKKVLFDK